MRIVRFIVAVVVFFSMAGICPAQNVKVSGCVLAEGGEAIAGAVLQLKGNSTVYAMTDARGFYSMAVPPDGTLSVSCLGYKSEYVAVDGRDTVDIVLLIDTEYLDDVIVVAYGTVRKEAATGSVSTIKADGLAETPELSIDRMMSGRIAGVTVTSETGQPGANSQIRIRGTSSINAGNDPLWVVDGIPVMSGDQAYFTNTNNAVAAINPNDIESITVLKDAAAASIYGSRAANGVILVNTKSGKVGKSRFAARVKLGASALANDNNFRPMTGSELLGFYRTAAENAGEDPDNPTSPYYYPMSTLSGSLVNWLEEVTRVGMTQEYEINASAGNDKGKFYSAVSYQNTDGVVNAVNYTRLTGRVNASYKLTESLEIAARVNLAYTKNQDTEMQSLYYSNPFFAGLIIRPWTPVKDPETGEYNMDIPENSNTNPLYSALCHGDEEWEKQYRTQVNLELKWAPVKGLEIKTNNMYEGVAGEGRRYWGPNPGDTKGTLQTSNSHRLRLTTSNTVTYNASFSGHSFRALVGQEAMMQNYRYVYGYSPDVDAGIPYHSTGTAATDNITDDIQSYSLLSFFGNLDYNYGQRFFAQASLRGDGSSLFGENNKWGLFWSASASWNLTNEKWMKNSSAWLSLLKLRLSYGVNGNNNISPYRAYGVYGASAYNGGVGMTPSSPANSNLSWEKNRTWNLGLDFAMFNGRLSGQLDLYSRKTSDMLLDKQVPATSGFTSNFMNIGAMTNRGLEFMLDGDIVRNSSVVWSAGFNIAFNKGTVDSLGDDNWMPSSYDSRLRHVVGRDFYTFYLKDYAGVDPSTGNALWWHHEYGKYEDGSDNVNEIISSTLTSDFNQASYVYAGSPAARASGGFNTKLSWKGLSLGLFFEFKTGNYVYIGEMHYLNADGEQMTMNQTASALNYWKQPGDTGCSPKPVAGNSTNSCNANSTRWLQRGDYLRIKDATLSYTLPEEVTKAIRMQNIKIYVSALNPYTFHDVNFYDPERGEEGMGFGIYPQTKSFVGGIELAF